MSSILIQNKGELPVWGIRLLGKSDKDERKIGMFGTGLKEAIALLARMDCLPTIYTGLLRVDFSIQTICEQPEISFRLSEARDQFEAGRWYGMGLHPNFGARDWKDAWQALREIVCNAQDEGELRHDITSLDPTGQEDVTRIYVPLNQKTLEAYGTLAGRLLFLSSRETAQYDSCHGRALVKTAPGPVQIYHKGVWVQQGPADKPSLYDYELPNLKLNESRACDWWSVNWEISSLIARYTKEQAALLIQKCIDGEKFYERDHISRAADYFDSDDNHWVEAFKAVYGERAVVTGIDAHIYDRLRERGYTAVVIADNDLEKLLIRAGCECALRTLTKAEQEFTKLTAPTEETQRIFDHLWLHLEDYQLTNDKTKPALVVFHPRPNAQNTDGMYHENTCYISTEVIGSEREVLACLEELCHHVSGYGDACRGMQTFLLKLALKGMKCLT